jgi:hypothetical protein
MTSGYADYLWDAELIEQLEANRFRQWCPKSSPHKPPRSRSSMSPARIGTTPTRITFCSGSPWRKSWASSWSRRCQNACSIRSSSTFWHPSWTITRGAIQYTNVDDLVRTARAVGTGELLSPAMHELQMNLDTRAIATLIDGCPACFPHSDDLHVWNRRRDDGRLDPPEPHVQWHGGRGGLPTRGRHRPTVVVTFDETAFDETGADTNRATDLFRELACVVSPGSVPPRR